MAENSFFVEKDAVIKSIDDISCKVDISNILQWKNSLLSKFEWLNATLSKYQEQPLLLNPHLPDLTSSMTSRMKDILFIPNYMNSEDLVAFAEVISSSRAHIMFLCSSPDQIHSPMTLNN